MLATVCGKKFEKRMLAEEKNESVDRMNPLCGCGCSLGRKLGGEAEPLPLPRMNSSPLVLSWG